MATLPTLVPTGDAQVGTWTTDSGGTTNLWQKIEETIAAATDTTDFIRAPAAATNTTANQYEANFTDTPSDFGAMSTLSVNVRYSQTGRSDDTIALVVRIEDSAGTALTSDITIANITTTTFTNSGATAFTLTTAGTNASKATWDSAFIVLSQTYTVTMASDSARAQVSAVELTGTYATSGSATASPSTVSTTVVLPNPTESVSMTATPVTIAAAVTLPDSNESAGATVAPSTILSTTAVDVTTAVAIELIAAPTIGVGALGVYAIGLTSTVVAAVNATSTPTSILVTVTLPDANGQPKMIIGIWETDAVIV